MPLVLECHQYIDYAVRVGKVTQTNRVFGYKKEQDLLKAGLIFEPMKLGQCLDMCQKCDDLSCHFFICKAKIDDILKEGKEGKRSW